MLNYKGKLHTEIFLIRLILERMYLKGTCILRNLTQRNLSRDSRAIPIKIEGKKERKIPQVFTRTDRTWSRAGLGAREAPLRSPFHYKFLKIHKLKITVAFSVFWWLRNRFSFHLLLTCIPKREWSKRANPPYVTLFPWKLFSIYFWFFVMLRGYFKD